MIMLPTKGDSDEFSRLENLPCPVIVRLVAAHNGDWLGPKQSAGKVREGCFGSTCENDRHGGGRPLRVSAELVFLWRSILEEGRQRLGPHFHGAVAGRTVLHIPGRGRH